MRKLSCDNILLPLGATLAIVLPWFVAPGYLFFTDFVAGPHMDFRWSANGLPLNLASAILRGMLPGGLAEKLMIAAVLFLLAHAAMRLASAITVDRRITAMVGLFGIFSAFVYDRLGYGQLFVLAGLSFLLLGTAELCSLSLIPDASEKRMVWAALWFGLAMQCSPHYFFFSAAIGACWLAAEFGSGRRKITGRTLTLMIAAALVIPLCNLNWLFVSSQTKVITQAGVDELRVFQTSGANGSDALANVIRMSGFWGKDQRRYADLTQTTSAWDRSFWLLAPLMLWGAVAALRDKKRRPLAAALLACAVVAVVLAVGVRLPSTNAITLWLFAHVPFYAGLRETQKWVAVLVVCYAVFLAWGTERLFSTKLAREHSATFTVMLCAVVVMQAPLLLWGMAGTVRPVQYPADWAQADALVTRDANAVTSNIATTANSCAGKRILFLPWHLYMGFRWIGNIVATPASSYFRCPVLQGTNMEWGGIEDDSGNPDGAAVEAWIAAQGDTTALQTLGITQVILAKDADWPLYAWLDRRDDLHLVQDSPTLHVYEVTH